MTRKLGLMLAMAALVLSSVSAFAQATTALSGVVVDSAGGIVPGATVVVKNTATGESFETVSNSEGTFSVPALPAGTYSVTVSLQGFKTAVISDIRLLTGSPQNVKATLEVGQLTETVTVQGGSELVQTQSSAVTATLSTEQLSKLPMTSRNSLYAASFLPGVETAYGSNAGQRQSTFSGLPQNTINVTLDGVTTGNLLQSGDGFFSLVTPRLDAVEEVTVTGATPGSGGGAGSGAVQVAFVTRSGSNRFDGSVYHYFRHPDLNTNTFFNEVNNLEKNQVIVHQYGARSGGPIVIPGLFNGRDKAFYFLNFEHLHQPSSATRTRTILNPRAQQGIYTYRVGGANRDIDLLALAAANGHTSTPDPLIAKVAQMMRDATAITGTVSTPASATILDNYVYQAEAVGNQYAPTGRLDYNINDNHRLSSTYYWQRFTGTADLLNNAEPSFPGFPNVGIQQSYRTTGSVSLRSTLTQNKVNELRGGWQWSPNNFFGNVTADMFDYQEGFQLVWPIGTSPANSGNHNAPAPRNTWNFSIDDTFSWLRGNHSLNFGAGYTRVHHIQNADTLVPQIGFGVDQTFDPAISMFTTANFPGASTAQLNEARALYGLITGRVTAITGNARLNAETGKYEYLGNLQQQHEMDSFSLFAQDSWRMTPTFTVNYGLRWEVQLPMVGRTDTWSKSDMASLCGVSGTGSLFGCNLFQPGNLAGAGVVPQYNALAQGEALYDTDWNNIAPSVGFAWRPNVENGWLRSILGDPNQATIRGGYTMTYSFERLDRFFNLIGGNPGGVIAATRNYTTGFPLLTPGTSAPVLLRDRARLGPPAFPESPNYPITAIASNNINVFDPNIETPYVHQYSLGFQRSLGGNTAFEVRYVGNRNNKAWVTENLNERIIFENGFLNEFTLAQANLRANIAAGRGATFAYTGVPGTSPLPIYLAYFNGRNASLAGNPASYTGSNWGSSSWTGHLGMLEPDPVDAINDLHNNVTFRGNALTAGLPANFAVLNPAITNANYMTSTGSTYYNSVQLEVRRRLADGFLMGANYTYARKFENNTGASRLTLAQDRIYLEGTDVPHSFKMNWFYELPFGRGRTFGSNMHRALDLLLGGWDFSGTGRLQRQAYQADGIRLVGMSKDELQKAFKIRQVVDPVTGVTTVFSLPQDIIDNTRRAFNTDPTSANHYSGDGPPEGRYIAPASTLDCMAIFLGDCDSIDRITLNGPLFTRFDLSVKKRFTITSRVNAELGVDVYNAFNNINFNHNFNPGGGAAVFQVTTQFTDINTTFDPGGRLAQLSWRINW